MQDLIEITLTDMLDKEILLAQPESLWLLLVIPVFIAGYVWQLRKQRASLKLSSFDNLKNIGSSFMEYARHALLVFRLIALFLIILAFSRPQSPDNITDRSIKGIDIVMAFDISTSMADTDFSPNRLEAAKDVGKEFIDDRPEDQIGVVAFAGEAFALAPPTIDHTNLKSYFAQLDFGLLVDRTAIGDGMVSAIRLLQNSQAVSKVIILLTDGSNNAGETSPIGAAEIAKLKDIRVYTIGVGSKSDGRYSRFRSPRPVGDIDEKTLEEIAAMTGGKYYRATDKNKLEDIYGEIDKLEKTILEIKQYNDEDEEYYPLLWFAVSLLVLEFLTRSILFRSVA